MKLSESIEGSLLQGKVEEMRKRRQTLQKTMMVILSMIVLSISGCSEKGEDIPLAQVDESGERADKSIEEGRETEADVRTESEEIYVYVCGEVRNPGVYKLEAGNRINHAIFAAGGMTDAAADTYLNQAEALEDGQKIYVPSKDEVKEQNLTLDGGGSLPADDRININTADKSQLTTLSGIGDSRAEAIITYRETVGLFKTIEEIQKIDGIKEGIFLKIKDKIKVE